MLSKASALGFVAPFLLNGAVGPALAGEGCKQAPAPLDSNRPALIDLSRKTPVFIAQAQPNCLTRDDGVDAFLDSQRRLNDGLTEGAERARILRRQIPGG